MLAKYFLRLCQFVQLIAELCELPLDQVQSFDVEVEGPPTPGYAVTELRLLPADWCIDGGNEEGEEHCLLLPRCLREHCEEVVHVKPSLVAVLLQERTRDPEQLSSDTLPPICAELGAKVADCVVVKLCSHAEQETTLFFAVHFYAFVRCFEV